MEWVQGYAKYLFCRAGNVTMRVFKIVDEMWIWDSAWLQKDEIMNASKSTFYDSDERYKTKEEAMRAAEEWYDEMGKNEPDFATAKGSLETETTGKNRMKWTFRISMRLSGFGGHLTDGGTIVRVQGSGRIRLDMVLLCLTGAKPDLLIADEHKVYDNATRCCECSMKNGIKNLLLHVNVLQRQNDKGWLNEME